MFNRLKTLTLMQMGNKYSFNRINDKKKFALGILFKFLSILAVVATMTAILFVIRSIIFLPVNRTTFLFLLFISQIISVITCTIALLQSLYYGKDNPILMSLPAKHHEVFVSKLLAYYINELFKNLYFVVPMFISFGLLNEMGVLYYINAIVLTFLLSMLPVLAGALLSIILMLFKQALKRISWIGVVFAIVVFVFAFVLVAQILGGLERPIRLIEIYNSFVTQAVLFMQRTNDFALIYTNIMEAAFSINIVVNYLIIIGVIAALALLVVFISMPIYFRMASFGSEHSVTKKHKRVKTKQRGIFGALFIKEFKTMVRNLNQVVQDYILVISMPIVIYLLNGFYWAMAPSLTGVSMIAAFDVLVCLLLLTASNTHTASAISSEGSEFGLLKTAPGDTKKVAWAKMISNFVISTVFIIGTFVMLGVLPNVANFNLWQIALVLVLVNSGHILWSFQIDLRNPQLAEYSEKRDGAENKNKATSVLWGLIMSVFMAFVTIFFMFDNMDETWIRIIGIAAGFFVLRLFLFINNLKVYFREIEM